MSASIDFFFVKNKNYKKLWLFLDAKFTFSFESDWKVKLRFSSFREEKKRKSFWREDIKESSYAVYVSDNQNSIVSWETTEFYQSKRFCDNRAHIVESKEKAELLIFVFVVQNLGQTFHSASTLSGLFSQVQRK